VFQPDLFEELRPGAFAVAYRMLGNVTEAEDIVQEALLRLHRSLQEGQVIDSPRAFLSTVVTRLCIDQLRSARSRRERSVDSMPEPVVSGGLGDPADHAEVADSLSLAFLVLLESLSPEQRAALLLRDVFEYPYDEIAAIIGTRQDHARQLVVRARAYVEARRPRFEPQRERRELLARRFFAAAQLGDLASLEALLAADVVLHGDGGGNVPALGHPLQGRVRVARTLLAWRRSVLRNGGFSFQPVEVNGQPGALVHDPDGRLLSVLALDIAEGDTIQAITSVVDPDKLRHLGPVAVDARPGPTPKPGGT
jgi:RNA polymerase sigma factor (sigma-70 family)